MSDKHFEMDDDLDLEEEDYQCQVPPIPFPFNESDRLQTLRDAAILDTTTEDAYDVITRLCSRSLQVTM